MNDIRITSEGLAQSREERVRMTAVSDADRLVNRLKNTNMEKFRTMCNMHLSFLLDMPGSDLEEFMAEPPSPAPSEKAKRTFFGSRRKISKGEKMDIGLFTAPLSMETIEQIHPLIEFLCKEESLKQEGIFRKAGQLNRQKVLRDKLNSGESVSVDLEQGGYSAHDCANLLKAYLAELPEPLLMEKYYKAFNQIPAMTKPGCSQEQKHLSEGKKLQTLQLLIQLLPKENFKLFECLIGILHNVHLYREHNKMSAEALGTLLAPCVLIHKKMSGNELQAAASNISKIMTFMIENSTEVLTVPQALVQDIRQYWEDMEEISENRPGSAKSEDEPDCRARFRRRLAPSDAVQTTVSFVDRIGSQEMDSEDLTQRELAKLYASVGQMAESAKKSKLVKKLNKRDGGLTPCDQSYVKHKRSKSLGESIRKMVGRNHKRRGSGHSTQVLSVMSSGQSTSSTESTSLPGFEEATYMPPLSVYKATRRYLGHPYTYRHTPVIKRMSQACNTPPPTTPVMRLFNKTDLQQPILPSSPAVHIVDLKDSSKSTFSVARKRKLHCDSPLLPLCPMLSLSSNSPLESKGSISQDSMDGGDLENIPMFKLAAAAGSTTKKMKPAHSPVFVTPDRCFVKPTAFISPITRSMNKVPKHVKANMMTPGSRKPMAVIQSPQ